MAPSKPHGAGPADVAVIGGGIIGLATAAALTTRRPGRRIALFEKEPALARHQTGHNSGVIHSGLYYRPGSLKATLAVAGAQALTAFCEEAGIRYERCGKVVIATTAEERPRLQALYERGTANGLPGLAWLGPEQLREREPHAVGLTALQVPSAGIVDFRQVADALARQVAARGGTLRLGCRVLKILRRPEAVVLQTTTGDYAARVLIACGGLQADRLAAAAGTPVPLQIIPFRGDYFELIPDRRHLVRALIYPVPDPRFPFLGVHFSRRIDGRVEAGPNAVLALKREGYRKQDVSLRDLAELCRFPGFWRMAARHWRTGVDEAARSWWKALFVRSLQRLVPDVRSQDLVPAGSGVRAQAVDRDGGLLDDFHLVFAERVVHVCNAPSPAATASLAIGRYLADTVVARYGL